MKIKFDFVSNSSSTSFVYISDEELSEESFFKAVGVNKDSPIGDLFHQMYMEIAEAIRSYGFVIDTKGKIENLAEHDFTPDVIERIKEAIDQGKIVIGSTLSSENGSFVESLLCTEIFEIESDNFYINAYSNYW